jgi:hypothetical protein
MSPPSGGLLMRMHQGLGRDGRKEKGAAANDSRALSIG